MLFYLLIYYLYHSSRNYHKCVYENQEQETQHIDTMSRKNTLRGQTQFKIILTYKIIL